MRGALRRAEQNAPGHRERLDPTQRQRAAVVNVLLLVEVLEFALGALEPTGLSVRDRLETIAAINGSVLNFVRAELAARGHLFRFYYAGRARDQLAFLPSIEDLVGEKLAIHTDDASGLFDVAGLMGSDRANGISQSSYRSSERRHRALPRSIAMKLI